MRTQFDFVHDIQGCYRRMVLALSRPGELQNLSREGSLAASLSSLPGPLLVMALTLLDAETTFALLPEQDTHAAAVARELAQLTYARPVVPEEAAYLIAPTGSLAAAIEVAPAGTLLAPHRGGTILAEVEQLSSETEDAPGPGLKIGLDGPGIKTTGRVRVTTPEPDTWITLREEKNSEFPLGVDLLLVDREGALLGLPRTTRVRRIPEEAGWDT
jgi:alpha-D-ribose 1-methylphosphonate 5-triphosphate synthase subunit PhnH